MTEGMNRGTHYIHWFECSQCGYRVAADRAVKCWECDIRTTAVATAGAILGPKDE